MHKIYILVGLFVNPRYNPEKRFINFAMKKIELITSFLCEKNKKNTAFIEFLETFYDQVSYGYILYLIEQTSKDVLIEIAEIAFEFFKTKISSSNFKILHVLMEKHGLQILALHSIDKPFVVRSTKAWLKSNNLIADEFIHPIFKPVRSDSEILQSDGGTEDESLIIIILPIGTDLPTDYEHSLQNMCAQLVNVVADFSPMQQWIEKLSSTMLMHSMQSVNQAGAFLAWLKNENFVFLGLRSYDVTDQLAQKISFKTHETESYGLFKIDEISKSKDFLPVLSNFESQNSQLKQNHVMQVQKKQTRSLVYRGSRIDCIELLDINKNEKIDGVVQIIGLFTSDFYRTSPFDVPLFKEKAEKVIEEFGFLKKSHNERLLKNILDSIPLDEFYYFTQSQLYDLIDRILNMYDRNAISARHDELGHSLSVLVYIPQHRYSEALRHELGKIISNQFGGTLTSTHGFVGDSSFARLIYILCFKNQKKLSIDIEELEEKIWIASQSWQERFDYYCKKKSIISTIHFSPLYLKIHDPKTAAEDAEALQNWQKTDECINFETKTKDGATYIRVYQRDIPLTLGQIIPIFTNFQLYIQSEQTFFVDINDQKIWLHYYEISNLNDLQKKSLTIEKMITGLKAAWNGLIEVDPYNALTVACDLDFKQIIILRVYGKFLKQLGFNYSQKAIAECLVAYPAIAQLLVEYFNKRLSLNINNEKRQANLKDLNERIFQEFSSIKRLDHDRILRRIFNAMMCTIRTNAYQTGSLRPYPCISIKVQSDGIIDIPKPSPHVEIFVYSPTMEGCHLRGGKIARGGIRWSDRSEDFRFEVLGLMKAQMVKNSVIVPNGSKGGFVVKNYNDLQEAGCDEKSLKLAAIDAYKAFIEQLLSITDNLIDNQVQAPKNIVLHDDEDPYLVVAADKGTATFSDIANELSQKAGFWLGDAFASGGSKGYDHKKLAITARGAWIAVRRHFWEMGLDCQTTPIKTVAVGDMAGDVFGNGMLQSTKICLVAAFNHRHIFIDPSPDIEASYNERKRLFNKNYSTWEDYNFKLISEGGGVYDRNAKLITITPQMAKFFGIEQDELSPDELISKILQADVDLLFFGGIGTFIKSQAESHTTVADRANDSVRIDAKSVRAKVIGEGANLGLTQLGRIEYALNGGHINTDAIDNSAGVDCSDHEVNLKIMCQTLSQQEVIDSSTRDEILLNLADEVCELVLEDNWAQTLILSRMQEESNIDINAYIALIKKLEKNDILPLQVDVENIPSDEELLQRRNRNLGFTRPELAIILGYSKIHLCQDLIHALKNTACFGETYYEQYFPKKFQTEFKNHLKHHPLKVEITATVLSNLIINTMGPCFVRQLSDAFRVDSLEVVRAFLEVLEETGMQEQLQAYRKFDFDKPKTLKDLRQLTRNLAQCVMLRLSSPGHIFKGNLQYSPSLKIPFPVLFNAQIIGSQGLDQQKLIANYKKLHLSYLWNWTETIIPTTSWQTGSWLLLQHDLIKTLTTLCSQTWTLEKLEAYNQLYDQLKNHISISSESSQHLLLLDYIIRQMAML